MPLSEVEVGGPVKASTQNGLIKNANGSPGRAVFTANGTWSVPQGVYRFIVFLAGGGGAGSGAYGEAVEGFSYISDGGQGGDGPLCSKVFSGVEAGTTYAIEIGAGGVASGGFLSPPGTPAGNSKFGTVLQSNGGGPAPTQISVSQVRGASGTHNGELRHGNDMFQVSQGNGYGAGGKGGTYSHVNGFNGNPGICVIMW